MFHRPTLRRGEQMNSPQQQHLRGTQRGAEQSDEQMPREREQTHGTVGPGHRARGVSD